MNTIMDRLQKNEFVLIAEIGVNYYDIAAKDGISPMDAAKKMITAAANAGIHAVKFQSYRADTLAAKDSPAYWDTSEETTRSQYELFQKYDSFGSQEYAELKRFSDQTGIEFLSTAFDLESADYLDRFMQVYKISSSDLNNLPFVAYQAKKGKPMILSTGASQAEEIDRTIACIRKYNDQPLVLMHCVLEYPTPYDHANLNRIVSLQQRYPELVIGYSDHTKPDACMDVIKTAYLLGARVVEKHFTLDKSLPGNDHYHAMDPSDAEKILSGTAFLDKLRGSYGICCLPGEASARLHARRSLVSAADLKAGTVIRPELLTYKRPGTGITPDNLEHVIGKRTRYDIPRNTVLQWNMLRDPESENRMENVGTRIRKQDGKS